VYLPTAPGVVDSPVPPGLPPPAPPRAVTYSPPGRR